MALDEIRQVRIEKLNKLKKLNVDPYPAKSWRSHLIQGVLENFEKHFTDKDRLVLVGRIMAIREHGGSAFMNIEDESGTTQIYFKKDNLGESQYQLASETLDVGDFIEVYGFLFKTKKEEKTLEVEKYRMLSKALLPLPEKWHGLTDVEERFRKRYLDLISNPEIREKFTKRTKIIQALRDFMNKNDFLEVMTPTLQPLYGGASARPFKTHLNALDIDLFLRIAPELYLKRLLVGGFEKVFEFSTNFRNEGMDRDHNPEFTGLEFYASYKDLEWAITFTEDLFEYTLIQVFGRTDINYESLEINFKKPYKRASFGELIRKYVGVDYDLSNDEELRAKADSLGLKIDKTVDKAGLADEIFKKVIRPKLIEPIFVTEWPVEILPLAKRLPTNSDYVGAFQFFAAGFELIKAFEELNDPLDQRQRFESQENKRAKGDEEAQRLDEDFLESLEYGMPPAAGWGLGVDRFIAMLTDSHSIKEVIFFPLMRSKDKN